MKKPLRFALATIALVTALSSTACRSNTDNATNSPAVSKDGPAAKGMDTNRDAAGTPTATDTASGMTR